MGMQTGLIQRMLPAYDFPVSFYQNHGVLASRQAFAENGINLRPVTNPVGYGTAA